MKVWFYRVVMKVAHHFNWHYAPPIYPEGNTQLWCKWCGFRQTIRRVGMMTDAEVLARKEELIREIGAVFGLGMKR